MNYPLNFHLRVMKFSAINFLESHLFVDTDPLLENYRHYNSDQRGNGAIFTCGGFSFAAILCVNSFFLFDLHSRNIDGFNDPNGRAKLCF